MALGVITWTGVARAEARPLHQGGLGLPYGTRDHTRRRRRTGRFVSGQRESSRSGIDKVMSEFTVLPRASGDVFAS
jgi:hypothetical protein